MRTLRKLIIAATTLTVGAGLVLGAQPAFARSYDVRPGDTLWAISRQTGVSIQTILRLNHPANPNLIFPGQHLTLPAPPGPCVVPAPRPPSISRAQAVADLIAGAHRHGVNPAFVLAVSWWESGWNQSEVSPDGAIGLMQITPGTAAWGGPHLLGHRVNLADPAHNADLGAALLYDYLQKFNDPKLALAAYYQGPTAAAKFGIFPSSRHYVEGIWALRNRFEARFASA